MKSVFVDTSGFYACLDGTDPFHSQAAAAFERAENECMSRRQISEAIAQDEHFARANVVLP